MNTDTRAWGAFPPIDVDTTTSSWQSVVRYVQRRVAALENKALSTSASDEERREAVIRRDELMALLAAPGETQRRVTLHADSVPTTY